jgi:hypothetical protein
VNVQGLLEIVQQATSRAHSPARSIPETIYDTTAESQSQRRRSISREQGEVPDNSRPLEGPSVVVPQETAFEDSLEGESNSPAIAQVEEQQQEEDQTSLEQVAPSTIEAEPQPSEANLEQDSARTEEEQQQTQTCRAASEALQSRESASKSLTNALLGQPVHQSPSQRLTEAEHIAIEESQAVEYNIESASKGSSISTADVTLRAGDPQLPAVRQDNTEASPPECPVPDEAAQFPFHSQQTRLTQLNLSLAQAPQYKSVPEGAGNLPVIDALVVNSEAFAQKEQLDAIPIEPSASGPPQASPDNDSEASQPLGVSLVSSTQDEEEDQSLSNDVPESHDTRGHPQFIAPQQTVVEVGTVVQSTYDHQSPDERIVLRRDFAIDSQVPRSSNESTLSREQNAQVIPPHHDLSTQEDNTDSIRPSIEKEELPDRSTPDSRHDSSQDTPERQRSSVGHSSSPIAQPPTQSIGTLNYNIPPRPSSPILTSSLSIMSTGDGAAKVARDLAELMAIAEAVPFIPTERPRRSNIPQSSAISGSAGSPILSANRRLLQTGAPPSDGTRSPSTVPDRSPAPSAPTSLRTVALTHTSQGPVEERREEPAEPPRELIEEVTNIVPAVVTTEPTVPEDVSSENEVLSDATDDDDAESLLNDDLQLEVEEHIVPLFIDGRQSDEYTRIINYDKDLLNGFVNDRDRFEPFKKVEQLLSRLRAVETHFDLVYAEAGSSGNSQDGATQIEFARNFGIENSVKFKFLNELIHTLREQRKHIVLLINEDNDTLIGILENFCKACFVQYNMPSRRRQSDPSRVQGDLSITIFPRTFLPIIQPADVIICLDGIQDARIIRQKNWAGNPGMEFVPVLHLVVSRTVGHIERYLPSSLSDRHRAHMIMCTLGQMIGQLGKPIDEDMPRAPATAREVAGWLEADEFPRDWPLGSIGSVKDVIEFQTQVSQKATSPAPERIKRPHDDEELDPAKRIRLTPQPRGAPSSSINNEHEITRISDSMPGTATDSAAALRAQLAHMEETLRRERAARKAEQIRYRDQEVVWDKHQTEHEDLIREYRILLGKQTSSEEKIETLTRANDMLRERLVARTTEIRTLTEQLDEQRNTHSLSDNAQITEITKLRTELAHAIAEKERAAKSATTAESTLDYTKEQYRLAQDAATSSAASVTELTAQVSKLSHAASAQPAKLKALHLNRQYETQATQNRSLKAENTILKRTLQAKEDELQRAKLSGGRMGVGTRATSMTPQPNKVRSRAASPMAARMSNLRNG